ncbi:MAG TPA: L,D-transpeptidase [Enterovirga sp.]|nr:L,D-transpeptidase [Enterovirga sp.]
MGIEQIGRKAPARRRAAPVTGQHLRRLALVAAVAFGCIAAGRAGAAEFVSLVADVPAGTILVRQSERQLYFVRGDGTAIRYPVAVGKPGKQWLGWARVDGKHVEPAWGPPDEVKRDNPRLPDIIPGGSPHNPMGARALTLDRGEYAIHGTNRPGSIGKFASYGCIRMHNSDVIDLFERVRVGTQVLVLR